MQCLFNGDGHRCVTFVCQEESQLAVIFDQMVTSLAFYQRNLAELPTGTMILDLTFNEPPTIEVLKAVVLRFLNIPHLNWNLTPLRFSTYAKSLIRRRRLRCYSPTNETIFITCDEEDPPSIESHGGRQNHHY